MLRTNKKEIRSLLTLAVPIALMQMGQMAYSVVDSLFMGRVSPVSLAGVGLGGASYAVLFLFGLGMLLGVDTLSSRAYGAGRPRECARIVVHAWVLAFGAAAFVCWLLGFVGPFYVAVGVEESVAEVALQYLRTYRWVVFPALLYITSRQYLQSMNITRPQLWAIALGNLLNVALNYVLIFGKLGFPALGVTGCALASVTANLFMLTVVGIAVVRKILDSGYRFKNWDHGLFSSLIRLGTPSGFQLLIEVGAFALAHAFMGRFGAVAAASHQITMNVAGMTFMVPLGISLAASVRVGQGIGRGDPKAAVRAGDTALILGAGVMACASVVLFIVPGLIVRLYTADPAVIRLGTSLIRIAAVFQIFDGVQTVLSGCLRGLGDTRFPFAANLVGHACFGLPLGYWLAFHGGAGPRGLWFGLLAGLAAVSIILYGVWRRRTSLLSSTKHER